MDLRLLGYVVAIAEAGGVSQAARRLRLSQPTLSRQLHALERRLGTQLFHREGRSLTPTPAGDALVSRARGLLAEAESTLGEVRLAARGLSGRVTLVFAGSGINGPLGAALGRLRTTLPDVDLRLVESFDDEEMSEGVREGRYDLAVQRLPARDPGLTSQSWWTEPLALYLPATHPLAQGLAGTPAELTVLGEIPLVIWPREVSPRSYDEILALAHSAGVTPSIAARGHSVQTLLALVAAGFGAAVLTDSHRVLRRTGVLVRPLAGTRTTLHLTRRATAPDPLLTRVLATLNASTSGTPTAG